MQCASSTTSSPARRIRVGSCSSRNLGLLSRSGDTSSTSTSSSCSCCSTSDHSCAFAELMATARTPARAAAATWSRMSASSGETRMVGPAPRRRSSSVATKYTADLPHPVRCTTSARRRWSTSVSMASYWPSRKSASSLPTSARRIWRAGARLSVTRLFVTDQACQVRATVRGRGGWRMHRVLSEVQERPRESDASALDSWGSTGSPRRGFLNFRSGPPAA